MEAEPRSRWAPILGATLGLRTKAEDTGQHSIPQHRCIPLRPRRRELDHSEEAVNLEARQSRGEE